MNFLQSKENQILERLRSGDRKVLGELYLHNERAVKAMVIKAGGGEEDAADALQEAIIHVWEKARNKELQLNAKLSTYLYAVARNKWLTQRRKNGRYTEAPDAEIESEASSPLEEIQTQQREEFIASEIARLSPICREILRLYYYEGHNMGEIAGLLGLANANVAKSKNYQCRKALAEQMLAKGVADVM
jgi:RNA polymerase sigma factor (sigma-70 family)